MAIDLDALKKAGEGDSAAKVTVTKAWLREVHKQLSIASITLKLHSLSDALREYEKENRA